MNWTKEEGYDGALQYERPGFLGGVGFHLDNAHSIKNGFNYNGSGEEAFGGAVKWPVVTAHIALPTGRTLLAAALTEALQAFIDQFLERNAL